MKRIVKRMVILHCQAKVFLPLVEQERLMETYLLEKFQRQTTIPI
ncbi:hypothetical protein [Blautia hydrogenotrophica]|nr:hypothetical protein [Blautia hydrogenotrophica]MEE0463070.1 hypothetical protein [Blautia hydrogenotrophica]